METFSHVFIDKIVLMSEKTWKKRPGMAHFQSLFSSDQMLKLKVAQFL